MVTGGRFTSEAQEFARKTKIELIDGKALEELIGSVSVVRAPPEPDAARTTSRSSIWREGDDQSSVVMDEPSSLDALIPRDEIDAGPAPRVALMTPQRLRFFAAQI